MAEYAKYYLSFLVELWNNTMVFFATVFSAIGKALSTDIKGYFQDLVYAAKDFDVLGWIALIIVSLINLALVFFLLFKLFLLLRRYVFFRSREAHKDMLVEEICNMKLQLEQMAKEKAQILNLRLGAVGDFDPMRQHTNTLALSSRADEKEAKEKERAAAHINLSRFTKLAKIDASYSMSPMVTKMDEDDNVTLSEAVDRFVNFAASQLRLFYKKDTIRRFFAGLASSKVMILEGISGTGKTSLPYAMGKFFHNDAKIVSVQPSWRDRSELIGYLNEFTKKFNETDFLAHLYEATHRDDINIIIIDEMNLARIEYYFAEFLSIMEMPDTTEWKIEIVPSSAAEDPVNIVSGKILVPQNVWFVGTANQDDSTFTITDKVYDRATAIEINTKSEYFDAPLTAGVRMSQDYLEMLFRNAVKNNPVSAYVNECLATVDSFLQEKFNISFGNRIKKQIGTFLPVYAACGGTEAEAFDFVLQSKVLRKLMVLNLPFLAKQLAELAAMLERLFGKNGMPISTAYIRRLQKLA